jgi:hypothetical protein
MFFTAVCCVFLSIPTAPSYADDSKSTFHFGPKGGINIAYQWGGDIPDIGDSYAGFIAGLFLRIRLVDFLMLQPEVLYSREGSSNLHIDYIQVPLFLKVGIPLGSVTPNVFAGPMAAFRVADNSNPIDNLDINDVLFNLAFGASVDIDIGSHLLTLEGRWTMSPMDSVTTEETILARSLKNGSVAFLVGFGF